MDYTKQLKEKINSYKSYNQAVKDKVLKQLDNVHLTEEQYNRNLKNLSIVMKVNKKHLQLFNKWVKLVYKLEAHTYAPELNKLHFKNGTYLSCPQKTTINEALEFLIFNNKIN